MKVLEIKKRALDVYNEYIELKLDNGEYLLYNTALCYLDEFDEDEVGVEDELDENAILENFVILKTSILDKVTKEITEDEFYNIVNANMIDIKEFKKKICDANVLNQYIRIINKYY